MTKTTVVWSCAHADPEASNERFDWLGAFLYDLKPDMVVDLGDGADMRSLNTYDTRYPQAVVSQSYEADIEAYNDSQDRLRHKFRHSKKKKPYWVGFEGNHECFQEYTEIYVKGKGWVSAPSVEVGDYVMGLDGQWDRVERTHKLWHNGPMYGYKSQTGIFSVTPSHRVYYYSTSGKLLVKPAKDSPWELDIPVAVRNKELKLTGLTDSELKFNAIALTDSYHHKDNLVFYQSGEKAKVIEQIIKDCGVEYTKTTRDRDIKEICGKELKSVQTSYEFRMKRPSWCVDQNKTIPEEFFYLTEDQFQIFLDMLVFCDGSPMEDRASSVFYGKKKICDDVQALCQTNGVRASIIEYRPNHFRVNINPRAQQRFKKVLLDEIQDWVYCVTVKGGSFLARQGGVSLYTGNCRIKKAIATDPRLEGQKYGISFSHLQTDHWFDDYHEYHNSGPAKAQYDGVLYSHFISSGNFGTAISGIHHAYTLLSNVGCSVSVGHSHKYGYYYHGSTYPNPIIGHVVGCFKGKEESWAGQSNDSWRTGVVVKRNLENGVYDHEWVSLKALQRMYG